MDQGRHRKEELASQLDGQRNQLSQGRTRLSQEFSLSTQLKRSVEKKPGTWIAGSLVTFALGTYLLRRPSIAGKTRKKGFIRWTLGTALTLTKPLLFKWALEKSQEHVVPQILHTLQDRDSHLR